MTGRSLTVAALVGALALGLGTPAAADVTSAGTLRLIPVETSFSYPTYVTSPPGDASRLFVTEQGGLIKEVHDGTVTTFADLTDRVLADLNGERGLDSIAFAPDYATSGLLYVQFTAKSPTGQVWIQQLRRSSNNPDAIDTDPTTQKTILTQDHSKYDNHNGGQLQFGPDGQLYSSIGDGGSGGDPDNNAQTLTNLLGKIVRITQSGAPAPGNPFASPNRPEIYLYGLRNPWRFSFDRQTGDLVIGDVGQSTREEVDFFASGQGGGSNLGWSHWEGDFEFDPSLALNPAGPYVPPVLTYGTHDNGSACGAITGGYVVRDPGVPELAGRYVYGDFCQSVIHSAQLRSGGACGDASTGLQVDALDSFGQDASGRIYAVGRGTGTDGTVYRLESTGGTAPADCFAAASGTAPASTPTASGDRVAPRLSRLTMMRRRFRVSGARTAVAAAVRPPGRGTAFRYTLSEPARVTFRIHRLLPGRRVGRRCLAPTRARRARPRCTRAPLVFTFYRRAGAGRRSTPFSGRIPGRPLAPGAYRATLRATDAAGNLSGGLSIGFTVVGG